jgi:hypothetical protein
LDHACKCKAKFLKENFDEKETFDFVKQQRKPFQVQYGLKKHVKNAGIPVF